MRKNTNNEVIEGYLYQHNIQLKKVENQKSENYGKPFYAGTIEVATDEDCLNVLEVHYTYVPEYYGNGKKNNSFTALQRICDNGKTVIIDGKENATKVKLQPSAALNDFYPQGQDELVSQPRNEGGFVTIINEFDVAGPARNKFTFDMLITHVNHVDADEERHIAEDYTEVRGAIFNFKNDLLPFTVLARNPKAMEYFEGLGVSEKEPVYTQVWGKIVNSTQVIKRTTESAFGEDAVDETQRKIKEWVVTGAKKEPYDFGAEEVMTAADIAKAVQDRNVMLAETKQRTEEYYKSKNNDFSDGATANTAVPTGGFSF